MSIIKLGSCFTGIGAWEKALNRLGVNYELQWFSEIDKYAIKSYCAVHNETPEKNMGDITQADEKTLAEVDMIVYSPPCQSFSIAGKGGGTNDSRGVLFYDALRIIKDKQPKCAVMENVKNLAGKKFRNEYLQMLSDLDQAGYNSYSKVLNSKDYGVPQNRERVFIVSIRKDIDPYKNNFEGYPFPQPFDNGLRLKDFLEKTVDEKYYISEEKTKKLTDELKNKQFKEPKIIEDFYSNRNIRIYDSCPTLRSERNGLKVVENSNEFNIKSCSLRTRSYRGQPQQLEIRKDDVSNTVTTVAKDSLVASFEKIIEGLKIRRLTPKECWRLQGFSNLDFDKAQETGNSETQLYRQAGNSITVDVLCYLLAPVLQDLFKNAFPESSNTNAFKIS